MDIHKSALVGYTAESMFDLIEAAEHYPAFLPWCADATILARDESVVVADIAGRLSRRSLPFHDTQSQATPRMDGGHAGAGTFRRFEGEWRLIPLGSSGCKIAFTFRYEFDAALVRTLAGPVFDRIANTFVDAFVARAERVFGASRRPGGAPVTPSATGG
jgi:ribosome-associated toxin RatA of RatAB toxin-antitoxin module